MAPEPDTPTREEPVVDLETWEKAGRAVVATVPLDEPIETCRGMTPDSVE